MGEHRVNVPSVWVVRGGDQNELASQVKAKAAVAVGFAVAEDVTSIADRDQMREVFERAAPGQATPNAVGQLFRFAKEISHGDYVLTPEKLTSEIHITRCSGEYRFDPKVFALEYPHVRPVEYLKAVARGYFPQSVRNTLGSTLTVFRADVALPYIEKYLGKAPELPSPAVDEREPGYWGEELEGQVRGQILEALDNIDHHDFQVFIAGLLEALEYRTRVGGKGTDGGVDILAHPDAFGLASPRIKVQVKNQKGSAGIPDVGYLNGVLGPGERGLFVCTGGFTKEAMNASFVKNGQVALVDGHGILDLVLQHYEEMPVAARELLPLRRLYVPEKPSI